MNESKNEEKTECKSKNEEKTECKSKNEEKTENKSKNEEKPENKSKNEEKPENKSKNEEKPENKNEENSHSEYKKVHKCDIIVPIWLPRKPSIAADNIDDNELKDSIKEQGLLNPLTVSDLGNGKYELEAGSRRLAAIDEKDVWVNIRKDDETLYDQMIICQTENFHRKDLPEDKRDDFYYILYQQGIKEGRIKTIQDLAADCCSVKVDTMKNYIIAGEERAKNKNNETITKARTSSLACTKKISNVPNVRDRILEMERNKTINHHNVCDITKKIEMSLNKGLPEKMISKMMDMATSIDYFDDKGNKIKVEEVVDNNNDKNFTKVTTFRADEFGDLSNIMAVSKPYVQECIIKNKIDWKTDATEFNRFDTKEQIDQLIVEKERFFKTPWSSHINIREQQIEEIKTNGDTKLKTNSDLEKEHKLNMASLGISSNNHDIDFLKKWRSSIDHLNRTILYCHPKNMVTEDGKKAIKSMVIEAYEKMRLLMLEIGELKTTNSNGGANASNNNDMNFQKMNIVDVDAKVTETEI